jgi:hypothetical protein
MYLTCKIFLSVTCTLDEPDKYKNPPIWAKLVSNTCVTRGIQTITYNTCVTRGIQTITYNTKIQ